jgi:hypothetical protein
MTFVHRLSFLVNISHIKQNNTAFSDIFPKNGEFHIRKNTDFSETGVKHEVKSWKKGLSYDKVKYNMKKFEFLPLVQIASFLARKRGEFMAMFVGK